jgi:ubiquinone/menaquinone biosynthesis C-methylase UbiE
MVSRFAQSSEIFSAPFATINKQLLAITDQNQLIDHREINEKRFGEWFNRISCNRSFYGARFWEYPFAILAADLRPGLKCADIGCGTTPFTPYLCEIAGKENVTGIDPDYVAGEDEERHLSFGARKSHIGKFGFQFFQSDFTQLPVPDNSFDRVFCISVLEHIDDPKIKARGLREMARIVKPGGKLIMTFDTGIEMLFNPPLSITSLTGLIPDDKIDLRWPEKRFVKYEGGATIDVFGLALEKPDNEVFADYDQTSRIPANKITDKYADLAHWYNVPYNHILKLNDLEKPMGTLRVWLKQLLGKY